SMARQNQNSPQRSSLGPHLRQLASRMFSPSLVAHRATRAAAPLDVLPPEKNGSRSETRIPTALGPRQYCTTRSTRAPPGHAVGPYTRACVILLSKQVRYTDASVRQSKRTAAGTAPRPGHTRPCYEVRLSFACGGPEQ